MKRLGRVTMEEAAKKEADIHEMFECCAHDDLGYPETAARLLYEHLSEVGQFVRTGDGKVFFIRYANRQWYRVTSKPCSPFAMFVAVLFGRNSRKRKTIEMLDHMTQHLRDQTRLAYVELESADGDTWREPLHFAAKKKRGLTKKTRRATRAHRGYRS